MVVPLLTIIVSPYAEPMFYKAAQSHEGACIMAQNDPTRLFSS